MAAEGALVARIRHFHTAQLQLMIDREVLEQAVRQLLQQWQYNIIYIFSERQTYIFDEHQLFVHANHMITKILPQ